MNRTIPPDYRATLQERDLARASAGPESAVTLRGIAVGALLCVVIGVGAPYTTMLLRGTPMGFSSCTPAAFFLLALLLLVHVLLRCWRRSWGFTRGELITATVMMMVAAAIPTRGVTGMLLPLVTGIYYYASPDNRWAELLHPHLAEWTMVGDPEAVRGLYEGGMPIPWAAWMPVLLGWLAFYAAFYLTLLCVMAILRRQWVEHERLPFPMAQVPLALFRQQRGAILPDLFRRASLWVGFAVPAVVGGLQGLQHYFPAVPAPYLVVRTVVEGVPLRVGLNFLMLGFAWFINTSIAFSLWFFYLLIAVEKRLLHLMGIDTTHIGLGYWTEPTIGHQSMGALIVLIAAGLWYARGHLRRVWRKAVLGDASIDDGGEILPFRWAVIGGAAGLGGMTLWLWQAGMPGWAAPVIVLGALVIFTGLTRAVAEGGIPTISPAMVPAGFVVTTLGAPALGPTGLLAAGHSLIWSGELLVFMMAPLANGLRLGSETSGNRRRLLAAIALAMLVTLAVSVWFTLRLAYDHGGVNLDRQYFGSFARYPAEQTVYQLQNPAEPLTGFLWMLGGGVVMAGLMVARQHVAGWPLHPLGFAVGPGWTMEVLWSSICAAWVIKRAVLRFGGAATYERTKPFFVGLILGQLVIAGLWLIVDSFTGTVGNVIPVLY
ncbi:MAG: hypothetical protein OXG13_20130 [Gemmatimonadaceae bacterium]|nr:hypothetical protein [Gemmatimonadaceae bacterium]